MNILHLKYAVEISRTSSLNKAAENLYMAQPNLSRAIKELEESIGITIFDRTPQGMQVTPDGMEFLQHAKKILREIDEVEGKYRAEKEKKQSFSISAPRCSYISYAFTEFVSLINSTKPAEIFYKETNSSRTINNILHGDYNLGIIRYASKHDKYFEEMLASKGLFYEIMSEFSYVLVMSKNHPLLKAENITFTDLRGYLEIAHADPYVPTLSTAAVKREELPDNVDRRVFVFERASQFDLLERTKDAFMWVSPLPTPLLDKFNLVQCKCIDNKKTYKDVLIYKNDYKLSELDKAFITELCKSKSAFL